MPHLLRQPIPLNPMEAPVPHHVPHHDPDYRAWFWSQPAADRATYLAGARATVTDPRADAETRTAAWAILRANREGAPMVHVEPGDAA